jgi:hypothetical protein
MIATAEKGTETVASEFAAQLPKIPPQQFAVVARAYALVLSSLSDASVSVSFIGFQIETDLDWLIALGITICFGARMAFRRLV